MATLIKGGRIVTAEGEYEGDILIDGGKVATIGRDLPADDGLEVHDASGLLVMPGAVDVHTHLDWEFGAARTVDTFGTGTMAAAFGGTTSVIDFANQSHGKSPLEGLADWHERCASRCVDVGAHMIILDPFPQALADLRTLARDEGVTSFKLFMAYPERADGRRRRLLLRHARGGQARRRGVRARRERLRDQRAGPGGGPGRQHRAQVPLPDPPARARGRSDRARHHARRIRGRAALCRARHLRPGAPRDRRGARTAPIWSTARPARSTCS